MKRMRATLKPVAFLCLLLILGSAIAYAAHHHSDGTEPATCTVCVAAHSASPIAPTLAPQATFLAVSRVRPVAVAAAKQRLIGFALTVRPPPEF
jgi:hypothetical protein